jgi:choline dehydrogenase-like flavoprotein
VIDLGLLEDDYDIFAARAAVRFAQRFMRAPAWRDYVIAPVPNLENSTDDALDQFLRSATSSGSHLVGTAGMSARGARYGVVDPDLLVKGMRGLRIIDASVMVRGPFKFERI